MIKSQTKEKPFKNWKFDYLIDIEIHVLHPKQIKQFVYYYQRLHSTLAQISKYLSQIKYNLSSMKHSDNVSWTSSTMGTFGPHTDLMHIHRHKIPFKSHFILYNSDHLPGDFNMLMSELRVEIRARICFEHWLMTDGYI